MKHSYTLAALASIACVGIGIAFMAACQSSSDDPPNYGNGGSGQGGSSQGGNAGNAQGGQGGGSSGQGGSTAGSGGGGQGGAGGGGGGSTGCMEAPEKSIADIAKGTLADGVAVKTKAVALTKPILTYVNKKKASCLWGVFAKDPDADYATMIMSYGPNLQTLSDGGYADCEPNTLFEGIVPGTTFDVTGEVSPYAPSTCVADGYTDPAKQMQVLVNMKDTACLTKTGSVAVPSPVKVTDIDGLATGKADFQALYVEINNVTAEDWADGGPVGSMGVLKIKGATQTLEIHDKFYYKEQGQPVFNPQTKFNKIAGLLYLDYCTWSIQPLDKCADFDPKSTDCK